MTADGGGVSRREFLESVAAVPIVARLDAETLLGGGPSGTRPHIVVVGAGAFGGWTALHLARLGAKVELLDAWGAGNGRSSSGGETRVIRSVYGPDRVYVEMVKRAFELWETASSPEDPLYVETGALWMFESDDAYFRSALPILKDLGFPAEQIAMADAGRRYPQIDFKDVRSVWIEARAGALSARRACERVRVLLEKAGGTYHTASVSAPSIASGALSALTLLDGSTVKADGYVFACGPWLGHLFPDVVGDRIRPTRQEVFYFGAPAGSDRYKAGHCPVWIDFASRIVYGIPDLHGRGFKVADDTRGDLVDPSTLERTASHEGLARARGLLARRFPELANAPLLSAEVCQYENSPDGNLIIDRHPEAKNVWLLGGGSGHGFKLSPAVGEMAANMVLSGKEVPAMFRLERLKNALAPRTQFEAKD